MTDEIKDTDFPADDPAAEAAITEASTTEASTTEAAATKAPAFKFIPVAPAQKDAHMNKIVKDKLRFDKWMHRLSLWSGAGAVVATGGLATAGTLTLAFSVAAAAVFIPPVAAAAAGLGALAVGSSIVRRVAVTGRPRKRFKPGGALIRFGGIFKVY